MEDSVPALVSAAAAACGLDAPEEVLAAQVCDGKKVSDHHAVVPTNSVATADLSALPLGEREVLRLVSLGLLQAVCPPYRYAETIVTAVCGGYSFTAKGKVLLDAGWRAYAGLPQDAALPDGVAAGLTLPVEAVRVKTGKTVPPKHFTEDERAFAVMAQAVVMLVVALFVIGGLFELCQLFREDEENQPEV